MSLSEKIAYSALDELDLKDLELISNKIGFILTVARDNGNWDLIDKLIKISLNKK